MGSTSSLSTSSVKLEHVPEPMPLDIPDARYATYDPAKKTDAFTSFQRAFESHVKTAPETEFTFDVDEEVLNKYLTFANKLCKEAKKKGWKCDVSNFGPKMKIVVDK